jgi:hypothetical protein
MDLLLNDAPRDDDDDDEGDDDDDDNDERGDDFVGSCIFLLTFCIAIRAF